MHELSIAIRIIDIAEQELSQHSGNPVAVHMRLGALAGVVKESLLSAWELARTNTPLASAELVIEEVPVVANCPSCQKERGIQSLQKFRCSSCSTPLHEIIRGRELEVVGLEMDS